MSFSLNINAPRLPGPLGGMLPPLPGLNINIGNQSGHAHHCGDHHPQAGEHGKGRGKGKAKGCRGGRHHGKCHGPKTPEQQMLKMMRMMLRMMSQMQGGGLAHAGNPQGGVNINIGGFRPPAFFA